MSNSKQDEIGDSDLDRQLWGAHEIARAINRSPRQTFYLLERGRLPAKKVGRLYTTTKRQLRAALSDVGNASG